MSSPIVNSGVFATMKTMDYTVQCSYCYIVQYTHVSFMNSKNVKSSFWSLLQSRINITLDRVVRSNLNMSKILTNILQYSKNFSWSLAKLMVRNVNHPCCSLMPYFTSQKCLICTHHRRNLEYIWRVKSIYFAVEIANILEKYVTKEAQQY